MTPVYLSQMFAVKETDFDTWEYLSNGGFCVNKSKVPFTSIGADHEMGNIVKSFCETFGIEEGGSRKRDEHYQLSGSKNERMSTNTEKVSHVLDEHEVAFTANETTSEGDPPTLVNEEMSSMFSPKRCSLKTSRSL